MVLSTSILFQVMCLLEVIGRFVHLICDANLLIKLSVDLCPSLLDPCLVLFVGCSWSAIQLFASSLQKILGDQPLTPNVCLYREAGGICSSVNSRVESIRRP